MQGQLFIERLCGRLMGKSDSEAVTRKAGDDMQMGVKDCLACRGAIGEVKIYPLATQPAVAQGQRNLTTDGEHATAIIFIESGKCGRMPSGNDKRVTGRSGVFVHESHHPLVLVHHAGRRLSSADAAEDAARVICHSNSPGEYARAVKRLAAGVGPAVVFDSTMHSLQDGNGA
jgi:hypothetical protein